MDALAMRHELFPSGVGRKPSPQHLFYALLLKAQRESVLAFRQETASLGIEVAFAEALLRRFALFNKKRHVDPVERVIDKYLAGEQFLDVYRSMAREHVLSLRLTGEN
jgi:hypothetical protein